MGALSICIKDLQIFVRDRGAIIMLFLLPFIFIVMLAFMGKNIDLEGGSEVEALSLTVVNNDPDGQVTQEFLTALEETGKVSVVQGEGTKVDEQLNESTLRYALFIPPGFSADVVAGKQVSLFLKLHPYYEKDQVMTIERAVMRAAREYLVLEYLDQGLEQMAEMQAANPDAGDVFSQERILQQVETQKLQAAQRPLITVNEISLAVATKEDDIDIPQYGQIIVVGMAVLFVFLGSQNTALSLFKEKRLGSFRRLMAAPLSKVSLLIGKLLPNFIISLIQIGVIFLTGAFVIPLLGIEPLDLSSDPFGLLIASFAIALCSTSLGIFIAAIARSENQVGGLSMMVLFLAGLLAGSFVPLFLFPEGLVNIARFVPQYWANQAYYGLIFRGLTLADIWINIIALLVFTLVFFVIGLWRFKFE